MARTRLIYMRIFAILGAFGVLFGAFGAHSLKGNVSDVLLNTWATATQYLFFHALAGLLSVYCTGRLRAAAAFLVGIFVFSGSLYALVLSGINSIGILTPFGGVVFIVGWIFFALDAISGGNGPTHG